MKHQKECFIRIVGRKNEARLFFKPTLRCLDT